MSNNPALRGFLLSGHAVSKMHWVFVMSCNVVKLPCLIPGPCSCNTLTTGAMQLVVQDVQQSCVHWVCKRRRSRQRQRSAPSSFIGALTTTFLILCFEKGLKLFAELRTPVHSRTTSIFFSHASISAGFSKEEKDTTVSALGPLIRILVSFSNAEHQIIELSVYAIKLKQISRCSCIAMKLIDMTNCRLDSGFPNKACNQPAMRPKPLIATTHLRRSTRMASS